VFAVIDDNLPRWDGSRRGFYEVWYLKLNHRESRTALWLRYTTLAPVASGEPVRGQVWAVHFDPGAPERNVAGLSTWPGDQVRFGGGSIVQVGDACFADGRLSGTVAAGELEISWDLAYEPNVTTFHHAPWVARGLGLLPTTVCSPNVDIRMEGTFRVGSRAFRCTGEPAQQGHIWGRRHGLRWSWAHCNAFEGAEGAVFEGVTAQTKLAGLESPLLTAILIRLDGIDHVFNSPWRLLTTRSDHRLGAWSFVVVDGDRRFSGAVTARPEDMVGVAYTDTDLTRLYCHNAKVGSMELTVEERRAGGFRPVRTLVARGTVALEYVDRVADPRVAIRIGL
jgi:hypothetical protein